MDPSDISPEDLDFNYESCVNDSDDSDSEFDEEDNTALIMQDSMTALGKVSFKSWEDEDKANNLVLAAVALSMAVDAKM